MPSVRSRRGEGVPPPPRRGVAAGQAGRGAGSAEEAGVTLDGPGAAALRPGPCCFTLGFVVVTVLTERLAVGDTIVAACLDVDDMVGPEGAAARVVVAAPPAPVVVPPEYRGAPPPVGGGARAAPAARLPCHRPPPFACPAPHGHSLTPTEPSISGRMRTVIVGAEVNSRSTLRESQRAMWCSIAHDVTFE